MLNKTIEAQVLNGHLQHQEPLPIFEGQKVLIQVIAISLPMQQQEEPPSPPSEEPPLEMDVEKEIYIEMPRKVDILAGVTVIDKGRRRPRLILPEELQND